MSKIGLFGKNAGAYEDETLLCPLEGDICLEIYQTEPVISKRHKNASSLFDFC